MNSMSPCFRSGDSSSLKTNAHLPPAYTIGSLIHCSISQVRHLKVHENFARLGNRDLVILHLGTSWSYGPSIDWAGVLVERVTGLSLENYMSDNIWRPLAIKDMTFFLSRRPDMQARATEMSWRDPSEDPEIQGRPVKYAPMQPVLNKDMEDCQGGGGIYASPSEFFKIVHALLLGDDGKAQLLRKTTIDSMFEPQLGHSSRKTLHAVSENPWFNRMMGGMPSGSRKDWGLGGLLILDTLPGWRRAGTMTWGGTPNLTWVRDIPILHRESPR